MSKPVRIRRFASPTVLTDDTEILGATAKEWNKALIGGFQRSLDILKTRVQNMDTKAKIKIDITSAPLDLASSYKSIRKNLK